MKDEVIEILEQATAMIDGKMVYDSPEYLAFSCLRDAIEILRTRIMHLTIQQHDRELAEAGIQMGDTK